MAAENPTWGEERIANELKLKLTIRVSPRTVGKYLRDDSPVRTPDPKQRWLTFVHNHAKVMVEALPGDHPYRFVIHDRDRIFSQDVDKSLPIWVYGFCVRR